MRKYRVSAMLYKYDNSIVDPKDRIRKAKSWIHSETIVAEDEWNAMEKYPMDNDEEFDEYDDIMAEEAGPATVHIVSRRESYTASGYTMTVGELVDYLEQNFDDDSPIYIVDGGYGSSTIFGSLDCDAIYESED